MDAYPKCFPKFCSFFLILTLLAFVLPEFSWRQNHSQCLFAFCSLVSGLEIAISLHWCHSSHTY